MNTLFRRSGFIGTVLLLFATLSPAVIAQTNVDGIVTADNEFEAYLGTVVTTQGSTSLGSSILWTSPVTLSTTMLVAGQTNYIQIVARNVAGGGSNPAMLIGEINLDGTDWEFANETQTLLTNTTDWTASATGFGVSPVTLQDLGARGTSPWTNPNLNVIDATARHIWPLGEQANLGDFYFWAEIIPVDAELSIDKTVDLPTATAGESTLVYTIQVDNAGPAQATGVAVDDTFPGDLENCTYTTQEVPASCAGGVGNGAGDIADSGLSLDAGCTLTYTASCDVSSDAAAGTLTNTATVTPGNENDNDSGDDTDDAETEIVLEADLSVTKDDGVTAVTAGEDTLTYVIVASNAGPSDVTDAAITDTFPADLECSFTAANTGTEDASGFTADSGGLATEINDDPVAMPAMSQITYTVSCEVPADHPVGLLSNQVDIVSAITDPNTGDESASDTDTEVFREAELSIEKTADPDPLVAQGTDLVYTFTITNGGPSDADDLIVNDTLPDGLTISPNPDGNCSQTGQEVTCTDIDVPADPGTASVSITVPIPEGYPLGTITNFARLDTSASDTTDTGGDNEDRVQSEVVVALPAEGTALIAVQKYFLDGNDETPVTLTLECTTGTYSPQSVSVQPDPILDLGNMIEHIFVIDQIPVGVDNPCTVVETPIAGYAAAHFCLPEWSTGEVNSDLCADGIFSEEDIFDLDTEACAWTNVVEGDSNLCVIANYPLPVDVDVTKVWETFGAEQADVDPDVRLEITCYPALGIEGGTSYGKDTWYATTYLRDGDGDFDDEDGVYIGEGTATFEVVPWWFPTASDPDDQEYTECWVDENASNNDLVEVDNGCGDSSSNAEIEVAVGMGDECTITNTVFFEGIPTLNQYGMAILALLMLGVGFIGMRRFV